MKFPLKPIMSCIVCALVVCTSAGQSTRRKGARPTKEQSTAHTVVAPVALDTVTGADQIDSVVTLTKFQKAVASRVESVMITNRTSTDTIHAVTVDIDYRTPQGEQLNRRNVTFRVTVPPGQTRHASVNSWDRQQLFYHIDTPPARKTPRTAPFTVTITPVNLILTHPVNLILTHPE